jgi:PII-like signaling protein
MYGPDGRRLRRMALAIQNLTIFSETLQNIFISATTAMVLTIKNQFMLLPGPAKKVTIHLNEDTSSGHDFLHREIFRFLLEHGVAGASLIRPSSGFGSHHRIHEQARGGVEGHHLPILIEFIESPEKLNQILPDLFRLVSDGLIEVQDTTILKNAASEEHV